MTERDWDSESDPVVLLDHIFPMRGLDSTEQQTRASQLYLIGCARRAWDRLPWVGRKLVELAERHLNREAIGDVVRHAARQLAEDLTHCRGDAEELAAIELRLLDLNHPFDRRTAPEMEFDPDGWESLSHLVYFPFAGNTPNYKRIAKGDHALDLLRDVFANPFRDARFLPEWHDRTVTGIARGMHSEQDFSPMPLLADALQDAGCSNEYILDHCRTSSPHIRGCWVLEGLLAKRKLK